MVPVTTTEALKKALSFPFSDKESRNRFLIGSALIFGGFVIPIIPALFAFGYVLRIMREAAEGKALTMPEWNEWGKLLGIGFRGGVVGFVYLLPGTLVLIVGMVAYFVMFFVVAAAGQGAEPMGVLFGTFGAMAVLFLSIAIGITLQFLGLIPLPMSLARFAREDRLAAGWRLADSWRRIRAVPWAYFLDWVIVTGLSALGYLVILMVYYSLILCLLAPVISAPIVFYILLVAAGLFGQTYRESEGLAAEDSSSGIVGEALS